MAEELSYLPPEKKASQRCRLHVLVELTRLELRQRMAG